MWHIKTNSLTYSPLYFDMNIVIFWFAKNINESLQNWNYSHNYLLWACILNSNQSFDIRVYVFLHVCKTFLRYQFSNSLNHGPKLQDHMVIKNVIKHLLIQISCSNRLELLKYDRSLDFLGRLRSIVRKCLLLFFVIHSIGAQFQYQGM